MLKKLLLTMAFASLLSANTAKAGTIRWHRYDDGSLLVDDMDSGQRLVLPEEWNSAQNAAYRHYAEINPDCVEPEPERRPFIRALYFTRYSAKSNLIRGRSN